MKGKFIYVGRLEKIKGIPLLLRAWRKMGDDAPYLTLCGKGPLEERCQESFTYMTIKGYLPNHEVRDLIADSDALILPSQVYEGFPMTVLEAFSVGTPVIGSNIGNVNALIEEGKNGLKFQSDSEDSLIKAVETICERPFRVEKRYSEKYSGYENYLVLKDIYDHLIR